jgi:hypothetical protein
MDSLEAAWLFKNSRLFHMGKEPVHPIHFIFLDDDHEYDHVLKELHAWYPLLSPGGIIAGHDWTPEFGGVEKAVTAYFSGSGSLIKRNIEVHGTSWLVRGGLEQ